MGFVFDRWTRTASEISHGRRPISKRPTLLAKGAVKCMTCMTHPMKGQTKGGSCETGAVSGREAPAHLPQGDCFGFWAHFRIPFRMEPAPPRASMPCHDVICHPKAAFGHPCSGDGNGRNRIRALEQARAKHTSDSGIHWIWKLDLQGAYLSNPNLHRTA